MSFRHPGRRKVGGGKGGGGGVWEKKGKRWPRFSTGKEEKKGEGRQRGNRREGVELCRLSHPYDLLKRERKRGGGTGEKKRRV